MSFTERDLLIGQIVDQLDEIETLRGKLSEAIEVIKRILKSYEKQPPLIEERYLDYADEFLSKIEGKK